MGEIKIQVTPSKPQNLEVGTKNTKNAVEITQDQKHYWELLAKEWAIKMSGLVQGVDYSSKYWANEAKKSSDIATASIETNSNLTEILNQDYQNYLNNLTDEHTQALFEIETKKELALTEIDTTSNNNVDNINNINNIAVDNIKTISNQSLTDISNAESNAIKNIEQVAENMSNYLPLTGGTLTGDLIFDQPDWSTILINAAKPSPTGTANVYKNLRFQDKETGESIGGIQLRRRPNGEEGVGLLIKHPNSDTYSSMELLAKPNGTFTTYAPASNVVNSIVTTRGRKQSGTSNYVWLGNDMILQWGTITLAANAQEVTVSLPHPFVTVVYSVAITHIGNGDFAYTIPVSGRTTTSFKMRQSGKVNNSMAQLWFAIGF